MDKWFTRLSILGITIYFGLTYIFACHGIDISSDAYRFPIEYCMYLLVKEHPKYHCRYIRFLALNILFTDIFTYIDSIFGIVPNAKIFLYILSTTWLISVIITLCLAYNHFKTYKNDTK